MTFFIEDLVPSLLGEESRASKFISREVLIHAGAIREAFETSEPFKNVCLEGVLRGVTAKGIAKALKVATFHRHHFPAYRIEIAALEKLAVSPLKKFCAWLATDDGASFHGWLAGSPHVLFPRQVQVARARKGDEFAVHLDMDDEGLAVVYNFTEGFGADDGGELYFPGVMQVPPVFNTAILFRPKDAPHGVKKIRGRRTRFTITAFFGAQEAPLPVGEAG